MTQVVSCRRVTAEARVRARVISCGICCGQSGTGVGFSPEFFVYTLSVSFHQSTILTYHVGNEQYARWRPQVRDVISPHQHDDQVFP
jgi:hypothetical protein